MKKRFMKSISVILSLLIFAEVFVFNFPTVWGAAAQVSISPDYETFQKNLVTFTLEETGVGLYDEYRLIGADGVQSSIFNTGSTVTKLSDNKVSITLKDMNPDIIYNFKRFEAKKNTDVSFTSIGDEAYILPNISLECSVVNTDPILPDGSYKKTSGGDPKVRFTWKKLRYQNDPGNEDASVPIDDQNIRYYRITLDRVGQSDVTFRIIPTVDGKYKVTEDRDNPSWYKMAQETEETPEAPASIYFDWYDGEQYTEYTPGEISENEKYPVDYRPVPGMNYKASIVAELRNDTGDSTWNQLASKLNTGIKGYGKYEFFTNIKYSILRDSYDNIQIIIDKIFDENESTLYTYYAQISHYIPPLGPVDPEDPSAPRMPDDKLAEEGLFMNQLVLDYKDDKMPNISSNGETREQLYLIIPRVSGTYSYRIEARVGDRPSAKKPKSQIMYYNIDWGSDMPMVPRGIKVESVTPVIRNNAVITADTVISWERPSNYDIVEDQIRYHIQVNHQDEEKWNDTRTEYLKDESGLRIRYREAKAFGLARPDTSDYEDGVGFKVAGDRYFFKLKGETAFLDENGGRLYNENDPDRADSDRFIEENSPLKPGETYFFRMYSTMPGKVAQDFSVPGSISIPPNTFIKPGIPEAFSIRKRADGKDMISSQDINLFWKKVSYATVTGSVYDSDISYELSIYTGNVGTDENGNVRFDEDQFLQVSPGDIEWENGTDPQTEGNRYARIRNKPDGTGAFANSAQEIRDRLGAFLKPNTTYYFRIRTWVQTDELDVKSDFSNILAVTTPKESVPPGDEEMVPTVPNDFRLDPGVSPNLTSNYAVFTWTPSGDMTMEAGVRYQIIWTGKAVGKDDTMEQIMSDAQNGGLRYEYRGGIMLKNPPEAAVPDVFDLDPAHYFAKIDGVYKYRAQNLTPNTVYYFSIRREKVENGATVAVSSWHTVTVTTTKIEPVTGLQVTNEYYDELPYVKEHALRIKWKALTRYNSGANSLLTHFDFLVKPEGPVTDEATGDKTDEYSKWYTVYQIKTVQVTNPDGTPTDYSIYYADIEGLQSNTKYYIKVVVKDGGATSREAGPAIGRTEFSQQDEDTDVSLTAAELRFAENVRKLKNEWIRTFFHDSYSYTKVAQEAAMSMLKSKPNSEFVIDLSSLDKIRKTVYVPYALFVEAARINTSIVIKVKEGEFYARPGSLDPVKVAGLDELVRKLNDKSSEEIKDIYISFIFTRTYVEGDSIDDQEVVSDVLQYAVQALGMRQVDEAIENRLDYQIDLYAGDYLYTTGKFTQYVKDYYEARYSEKYDDYADKYGDDREKLNSLITTEMLKEVDNWFKYGISSYSRDGVKERLDDFLFAILVDDDIYRDGDDDDNYDDYYDYYDDYYDDDDYDDDDDENHEPDENDGDYIYTYRSMTGFSRPFLVKYGYRGGEQVQVMLYTGKWEKINTYSSSFYDEVSFDLSKPGRIAITKYSFTPADMSADDKDYESIVSFAGKYRIDSLLGDSSFLWPDQKVKVYEILKIARRVVTEDQNEDNYWDEKKMAAELELTGLIDIGRSTREVTRQEAALVLIRTFEKKSGVATGSLKPRTLLNIRDDREIGKQYFKSVELVLDLKILSLDGGGRFGPALTMTRGELLAAFKRMLDLL